MAGGYDLIGEEDDDYEFIEGDYDDDDDEGSVGYDEAELIGEEDEDDEDLLEALSVAGAGDTEIIGRRGRKRTRRSRSRSRSRRLRATGRRRRQELRSLAMRGAGAVVNRGLSRRRRYPLGFQPTNVAIAATLQIPASPQNLFRPERLVIPSDIAFDLGVVDIKVGNASQLVQSVEVPAAVFSEVAEDTNITFDTAEVGNQISVQIRNKSAAAVEFTAGLIGTIAKQ